MSAGDRTDMLHLRRDMRERMAMRRGRTASWCVVVAFAVAGPGYALAQEAPTADEREARTLFDLGSEAYQQARYDRALKYFEEAYELSKKPGLLYNLGLTYSNLRRDDEAIDAFERYLAEVPNAENREAVENRLALLKKQPAPAPASVAAVTTVPTAVPTPEETARAQVAATEPPPPGEPYRDEPSSDGVHTKWWFWAGIGGAVVAGVLIGVVAASGGDRTVEGPALLDDMTRVREL